MMLCRMMAKKRRTGAVPVYLNVYDLTPINGYAYWLGLGVYHSGIQVHGVEYGFGAHDHSTTGIFDVEPKQCPGFTFRKSILIGRTDMDPKQVRALMEKLSKEYSGNTYNLITKNCNHFCNHFSIQLTGKPIPRWVNRLARLGLLCNCVLPAGLSDTKVRHVKAEDTSRMLEKKKKLRRSNSTGSSRFEESKSSTTTTTTTTLSSSSCSSAKSASAGSGRGRRQRRCNPPSTSSSSSSSSYSVTTSSSGTPNVV